MIGIVGTYPTCGPRVSQHVGNKWQSTSPGMVRQYQKLDAAVDENLPDHLYLTSIFSKLIDDKLSDGSSGDLYTRCRMKFAAGTVQNQTPKFMDLGFMTINALDVKSGLSTPATITLRPMNGAHWSVHIHVFGETIAVGVSEAKSDYDYNYITEFLIWKENKEFERQNLTTFGIDYYWYEHERRKNITFEINSCCCKNSRPQTNKNNNVIVKAQRKSEK